MLGIYPREELSLYDSPTTTQIICAANAITSVCAADPDRVVLILSNVMAAICFVAPAGQGGSGKGFALFANSAYPMVLTQAEHGSLCQIGWEVYNNGAQGPFSVIAVTMRRPPIISGFDVFKERGNKGLVAPALSFPPARKGNRRAPLPIGVRQLLAKTCPKLYPGGE